MGREIRMVPPGWEHPKDENGDYISMIDQTFEDAAKEWKKAYADWENGTIKDDLDREWKEKYNEEYWEWHVPPDRDVYRPAFTAEPTHFQLYQNVSEGTPVSPVFATKAELQQWLTRNGYSEFYVKQLMGYGSAFSMYIENGAIAGPPLSSKTRTNANANH